MPITYDFIATATIDTSTSSVLFSNIPQTYTDLVLVMDVRFTQNDGRWLGVRPNGDSGSNYQTVYMGGSGTGTLSATFADNQFRLGNGSKNGARAGIVGYIAGYANTTTYKASIGRATTNEYAICYTTTWRGSTGSAAQAITSLTFVCDNTSTNQFAAGSMFSIYGIKAA